MTERSHFAPLVRTLGIIRKEISSVLRQPRLIFTLILGPFLIVLVFGLGYRSTPAAYRAIVVNAGEEEGWSADPDELSEMFGEAVDFRGVEEDLEAAKAQLRDREVDLVIVTPGDPIAALADNEQARFLVLHTEADPAIRSHIGLLAEISVDRINRRVLEELVSTAQGDAAQADDPLTELERALVEAGDDRAAAVSELSDNLVRAESIDPQNLVRPFAADVEHLTGVAPGASIYYVPGTLVLLIQHVAITFAALSLVRERELGLTDLFRVSPLRVGEALAGKYLAFLLLTGSVAAILTVTMLAFGIPAPPSWLAFSAILGLVIVASLGLGFLISAISRNDSQAVQYSMTVLLLSIFFTGFMLPLDQLTAPVQTLSYLIPATYGVAAAKDLLFNGVQAEWMILGGLAAYAVLGVAVSWRAIRKDVVSARS